MLQELVRRDALLGVLLETTSEEIAKLGGRGFGVEPWRWLLHNVVEKVPEAKRLCARRGTRRGVRKTPKERLHQAKPQGPDVRVPALGLPADALGRHISNGSHPAHALGDAVCQLPAYAEVRDLHLALLV